MTVTTSNSTAGDNQTATQDATINEIAQGSHSIDESLGLRAPTAAELIVHDEGERHVSSNPRPKFKVGQLVYAADQDGLMYESTIRKMVFGSNNQTQVIVGMSPTVASEGSELFENDEKPSWHYFVHYHGWSVKWDRWSSESRLFEKSEASKQLAAKLLEAHRALKHELFGKRKGSKTKGAINAGEFLMAWRQTLMKIQEAFENGEEPSIGPSNTSESTSRQDIEPRKKHKSSMKKDVSLSKTGVEDELQYRGNGLTRLCKHADKISLPSTLKKVLVDSWEIITQCKSVPDLPAPITIKDALNKYLQSKGIDTLGSSHDEEPAAQGVLLACDDTDKQAWIDTRDGLCQCFDEALPSRILYAEELPQLYAMDSNDNVDAENTYSEVYGCEHLLRLFTRLPELLLSSMSEAEARPIFAKINDFIRFLHKDNSLFSLNYRPYNDDELKQVRKIEKIEQKKRKRQSEVDKTVVIN